MKKISFLVTMTCALLILGGRASAQSPADRLVRIQEGQLLYIDDTLLTVGDFAHYLRNSGVFTGGNRQRAMDTLRGSLEAYTDQLCIILDMDSVVILADAQSLRRARWRQAQVAGPLISDRMILPRVQVDDAEIERFHRDSIEFLFTEPESREVRHILIAPEMEQVDGRRVKSQARSQMALETAESLLVAIEAGASFDSLARAFSADSASRVVGGYIGWIYPGNTVAAFDSAAFSGQAGDVLGPVKTMYGFHLIKIEAARPESVIPLNDTLTLQIKRTLTHVRGVELGRLWADSMLKATHWTYNDAVLSDLRDVPDTTWLLLINDRDTLRYGNWDGSWMLYQRKMGIKDGGTLQDKHESLRLVAFPYLYIQTAEEFGFADDPLIVGERLQHISSEAIRLARAKLREMQAVPQALLDSIAATTEVETIEAPLHLQMIRTQDTASIWAAYRRLVAGDDMATVARWYHDNLREVRQRAWDLGWLGQDDLPSRLWGAAWILRVGRFTRPIELDSSYYILKLVDREETVAGPEKTLKRQKELRQAYRQSGLKMWRSEIRSGHSIRLNPSYWRRVQQLWWQ